MNEMRRMIMVEVDRDTLVSEIVAAVVDKLNPQLPQASPPHAVDCEEMARLLSVSASTIDRLRKDGKIPSKRIGTRRVFEPEKVLAALDDD